MSSGLLTESTVVSQVHVPSGLSLRTSEHGSNADWPELRAPPSRWQTNGRKQPTVLTLDSESMTQPTPSAELPSAGSLGHVTGACKPCVFLYTKGCNSGIQCEFCHLCGPNEKKNRQKAKRMSFQQVRAAATQNRENCDARRISTADSLYSVIVTPPGAYADNTSSGLNTSDTFDGTEPRIPILAAPSPPAYNTRRPSLLRVADENGEPSYIVRNTFIETPFGMPTLLDSHILGRAASSCPASKIGGMRMEDLKLSDDVETLSPGDFASEPESPQSLSSMLWPATPEPPGLSDPIYPNHRLCLAASLRAHTDAQLQVASSYGEMQLEAPSAAWNACIEAPSGKLALVHSDSACPASSSGKVHLTDFSECDDGDVLSMDGFLSSGRETPQSFPGMQWPGTPEPKANYATNYGARMLPFPFLEIPIASVERAAFSDATPMPALAHTLSPCDNSTLIASSSQLVPPTEYTVSDLLNSPSSGSRTLSLAAMLDLPNPVLRECEHSAAKTLPSLGSTGHSTSTCKPCGFFHKAGCAAGAECNYCHLCDSGEKKRRQREKREMFRDATRLGHHIAAKGGA